MSYFKPPTGDGIASCTTMDWYNDTAPTGYLRLDGAVVSRTTYANIFAMYGTTFGAGDGSTTFKLPDYKGKAILKNIWFTNPGVTILTIASTTNMPTESVTQEIDLSSMIPVGTT